MALARRKAQSAEAPMFGRAAPSLRAADGSEAAVASPVHGQQAALAVALSPDARKYPRMVRAAIAIGGSVTLWAVLIGGATRLVTLIR